MAKMLIFDWMCIDEVLSHIEVNPETRKVKAEEYNSNPVYQFFVKRPYTIESIVAKFKGRCFEEGRPDKDEILESMGLRSYSPLDIVRHTHGHTNRDDFWIRFEGENLAYFKDVNTMRPTKEERSNY